MRSLAFAIIATTALMTPAYAQSAKPSPKVEFGKTPADALVSGDIIGLTAYNGNKDSVGEIKDIVIDHGKLVGYVLSVGGFLGMGEHYVEVMPSSVAINYDDSAKKWSAIINANKTELRAAPEFAYSDRTKH